LDQAFDSLGLPAAQSGDQQQQLFVLQYVVVIHRNILAFFFYGLYFVEIGFEILGHHRQSFIKVCGMGFLGQIFQKR